MVLRTLEAMLAHGAHVEDISVLLGPAVSGVNYEVPEQMAADVEARLPGSRTTTAAGTPGLDLRAGIARQLAGAGVTAIDVDPRCTVADRRLFSHRRDAPTGRLASLVWDGMTAGQNREADLVSALGALRSRLAHAAEAAGRNTADIELLPITKFFPAGDVAILWRLGCRSFGGVPRSGGDREDRRVRPTDRGRPGLGALAHGRPDPEQEGQNTLRSGRIRCTRWPPPR